MKLDVIDFFKYFIIHPDSDLLDTKTDRVTALISSIALGIFTLGLCHLVCAVVFRSYKPLPSGSTTPASDVARRVLDARPPDGEERREARSGSFADKPLPSDTKTPVSAPEIINPKPPAVPLIDKAAADRARLEKLGFTLENVYTKIQVFLSSSEDSLSLARDRVITIKNSIISLNFSDVSHDLEFLFQKALEKGKSEGSADFDNVFVRILQTCQTLSLDYEGIISFKPFINLEIQEPSSDDLKKEIYPVPTQVFFCSPIMQRMLFGSFFSFVDSLSITLPESYSIEHFKVYVEMSIQTEYDFSNEDISVLLDMLPLADYFEDRDLVSRLDKALKASRHPTLENVGYLLEIITNYPQLEIYISPLINALIREDIIEKDPLHELVARLHSLDTSEWLKTHTLALDLSGLGSRVNDTVLESLSGLKVSSLTIQSSKVTRLPDAWLTSLHALNITDTEITVLQDLPELRSLRVSQQDPLIDISSLDANTHLESIDITAAITRLPVGLTSLKTFRARDCRSLTDLDALNNCASLEELSLVLLRIQRAPTGLTGLKKFTARMCPSLRDLNALNDCTSLEELSLEALDIAEAPTGLTGLKKFHADLCLRWTDLDVLNGYASLKELSLVNLRIQRAPTGLTGLKKFGAVRCPRLIDLDALNGCTSLEELRLESLNIAQVPTGLTGLKKFYAYDSPSLTDLDALNGCESLEELSLAKLNIQRVPIGLTGLKTFTAQVCDRLTNLDALNDCRSLEELGLNVFNIAQAPTGLTSLKKFRARDCRSLTDLDALNGCEQLEELSLEFLDIVQAPTGLRGLKQFSAIRCLSLTNLDALADCTQLKQVTLFGLTNLARIPPKLREVKNIGITDCPLITAA